jgi:Ethanolamine utilization protein EutJ (predicted chaperonin)
VPEVVTVTLECDHPGCEQHGRHIYIGVDPGAIRQVILCPDHEDTPVSTALKWARPGTLTRAGRAPARPAGANRSRLLAIKKTS